MSRDANADAVRTEKRGREWGLEGEVGVLLKVGGGRWWYCHGKRWIE